MAYYLGPFALFSAYALARAEDVTSQFQGVADSFATLPDASLIKERRIGYLVDTGSANAIVVALPTAPDSYQAGLELIVKVAAAVTGSPTVNVNGLGARPLVRSDGSAVVAGDIPVGSVIIIGYDGDNFRVLAGGNIAGSAIALAQSYAASALNAPGTSATSVTPLTIGTGSKSLTLAQVGKQYSVGQTITVASTASPLNQMVGICTAFVPNNGAGGGDMTVQVSNTNGSGSFSAWTVSLGSIAGTVTLGSVVGGGLATGGGNVSSNQTITVTAASAAQINAGTSTATAITPKGLRDSKVAVPLTSGASISVDHNDGMNRSLSLAHNATLAFPTNVAVGESWRCYISVTGAYTLNYAAGYVRKNGATPAIGTTPGQKYLLEIFFPNASEGVYVLHGPVS